MEDVERFIGSLTTFDCKLRSMKSLARAPNPIEIGDLGRAALFPNDWFVFSEPTIKFEQGADRDVDL